MSVLFLFIYLVFARVLRKTKAPAARINKLKIRHMNENKQFDVEEVLAEARQIDNLIATARYEDRHGLLVRKAAVLSRISAEIIRLEELKAHASQTQPHGQLSLEL